MLLKFNEYCIDRNMYIASCFWNIYITQCCFGSDLVNAKYINTDALAMMRIVVFCNARSPAEAVDKFEFTLNSHRSAEVIYLLHLVTRNTQKHQLFCVQPVCVCCVSDDDDEDADDEEDDAATACCWCRECWVLCAAAAAATVPYECE